MGFYFNKLGIPKYRNIALLTGAMGIIQFLSNYGSLVWIKDNSMVPYLKKGELVYYSKNLSTNGRNHMLKGKVVLIKNPKDRSVIIRRIIGSSGEWV